MSGYRAALRWYYKREDVAMPVEYSKRYSQECTV
ncbi:hypothetical protein H310_15142 [Aphanomyces invadans]|uniref:Uncharacterized protein n=1 Tax=Aphanomyces invadans TaxID=157072 RepID=A0A024T7X4_9STRA|nr:hypothetical protein H310_15142 [Aphanomyces invadans]ETV90023.1 hypothetical protein H310_15142 [Aphanomyces invadans]|eukprot:XP_008881344.1 hypothetical protein H310_15142 [Aphanomyces invadans]